MIYFYKGATHINLTNRCTNNCYFCLRHKGFMLEGQNLKLEKEPTIDELLDAVAREISYRPNKEKRKEITFCGIGEPLLRLDDILKFLSYFKGTGIPFRIVTNGHAKAIYPNRNVAKELFEAGIKRISISMNTLSPKSYEWVCRPKLDHEAFAANPSMKKPYAIAYLKGSIISFIKSCKNAGLETEITAVDISKDHFWFEPKEIADFAYRMDVKFRLRPYHR